jgi:hypothetical protein
LFSGGQIGDGTIGTNRLFPTIVNTSLAFTILSGKSILITGGGGYTCVIADDSNSYCWGENKYIFISNTLIR